MALTDLDKDYLLKLSRNCLNYYFVNGEYYNTGEDQIPDNVKSEGATFVTLQKNGSLRGCMGKLVADQPVYLDVVDNTYSAAFRDPRFPALERNEVESTKIEISLLSELRKLEYKEISELIKKLEDIKPGVLIKSGLCQATFLPQVWESITDSEMFLTQLCLKAGLKPDSWRDDAVEVEIYDVIKCCER